jgi:hypothetical protein
LGLLGVLTFVAVGCGGNLATNPTVTDEYIVDMTGNWQIAPAVPNTSSIGSVNGFAGYLVSHPDNTVTGELRFLPNPAAPCVLASPTPFSVSGTTNVDNQVSLVSSGFAGGTVSISLGVHPYLTPTGTYSISGGPCAGLTNVSVLGAQVVPLGGTYKAEVVVAGSSTLDVVLNLTGSTVPNANAAFPFTGSATFTAPSYDAPCSFTVSNITGIQLGESLSGSGTVDGQPNATVTLTGLFTGSVSGLVSPQGQFCTTGTFTN